MSVPRLHRHALFWVLTLFLVFACGLAAEAAGTDYSYIVVARGEYSDNLINIKAILYNRGYYDKEYGGDTLLDSTLDDMTMNALRTFAKTYPDEPQYDGRGKGLTAKAEHDLLYNQSDDFPQKLRDVANPEPIYRDIRPDTANVSDEIGRIQDRLIELGYLAKSDPEYRAQELTDAVFNALDKLLDENHKPELKRRDMVTKEVQRLIFSEQVIANQSNWIAKLRGYFLSPASLLGLRVPMLVVWIVGILLLIACVVAIIHFFGPSEKESTSNARKGRKVRFEIAYGNKTQACEVSIDGIFEIGRYMTALPIDSQDNSISHRHCELYFKDNDLMLRDYSRYGTNINGEVINNTQRQLNPGDTFVIGRHQIRITWKP